MTKNLGEVLAKLPRKRREKIERRAAGMLGLPPTCLSRLIRILKVEG